VCKSAVPLVRKPDARKSHIQFDERDLETEETVRYSDTDKPKGSETVTAEPNSTVARSRLYPPPIPTYAGANAFTIDSDFGVFEANGKRSSSSTTTILRTEE
jgi:hypothetical protein